MLRICTWDRHFSQVTISLNNLCDIRARIEEFQSSLGSYIHPVKTYTSIPVNRGKRNVL